MYASYDERTNCMVVMMRGPIVSQLCMERKKETSLDDKFPHFSPRSTIIFWRCQFTTLAKYSSHIWSLFGANID